MKIKRIFLVLAMVGALSAMNVRAQLPYVRFIEDPQEVAPVAINYGGWLSPLIPGTPTSETAAFNGSLQGNWGSGFGLFFLYEGPTTELSDYVSVQWSPSATGGNTDFHFDFYSDKEGETLNPPPWQLLGSAIEDGNLQTFTFSPNQGPTIEVGMWSDPPEGLPDAGSSLVLMILGFASLAGVSLRARPLSV